MKTSKWATFTLVLAVVFLGAAATLHAQWTEGTITGTVTDPSGAALPGARIVATSQETGRSYEAVTNNVGYYRLPNLPSGKYDLRVEASGFKVAVVKDLEVLVNVTARSDVALELGAVGETVEVIGGVSLVQTEEARLADSYTTRQVEELPLEGRDIYRLPTLQPGVTATLAPVISNTSFNTFDNAFISNGASVRGNNFVLDGTNNNNEWLGGTPAITPSVEAIEEFQVQTLNFSAEYGRNNGSITNIVTKSGTNDLHGGVFYFHRNSALDARTNFDGEKPAPLLQHQFGAQIGGPIIKDQTFFFFNYEGTRNKRGVTQVAFVETPEFRELVRTTRPTSLARMFYDDFPAPSCVPGTAEDRGGIADPGLGLGPFAGGDVDGDFLADPDGVLDYCEARLARPQKRSSDQYLGRIDHNFTDRDKFTARFLWDDREADTSVEQQGAGAVRDFQADLVGEFADLNVGYLHTFSPTFLNNFRFAYHRQDFGISINIPPSQTRDILESIGRPDFFGVLFFDDGAASIGNSIFIPRNFVFDVFTVSDVATHIVGNHTLKYGFDLRWIREESDYQLETRPFFEFNSIFDYANDDAYWHDGLIDRDPSSSNFGKYTGSPRNYRWAHYGWFIQDDWKVRRNLTLNLGLRHEIFQGLDEKDGKMGNVILGSGASIYERIANGRADRVESVYDTEYTNFSPRIGLAWDPMGDGKMSVRMGFAVAYLEPYSNMLTNSTRFNPPFAAWVGASPVLGRGTDVHYQFPFEESPDFELDPTLTNGLPLGMRLVMDSVMEGLTTAYSTQWFLGFQRELFSDYSVSVNYVGTRGIHLYLWEDWNRFRGDICNATTCDFTENRLNPEWGNIWMVTNGADSIYHGGNIQLKKTYSRNFMFVANYTVGQAIDWPSSDAGLGDFTNISSGAGLYIGAQDINNRRADRGPSEFDVRHRFTFSGIWDLPSFSGSDPWVQRVFGDWQLNGIVTLQAGRPFTVSCQRAWFAGCDFNMDGRENDRPNNPGLPTTGYGNQDFLDGVFSVSDFCPGGIIPFFFGTPCLPVGTNGNLGRNTYRGPGFASADMSLFKNIRFGERYNLQFRWEMFNMFNRVNLWIPNNDLGGPFFGQSKTAFPGRQMQFALKFLF